MTVTARSSVTIVAKVFNIVYNLINWIGDANNLCSSSLAVQWFYYVWLLRCFLGRMKQFYWRCRDTCSNRRWTELNCGHSSLRVYFNFFRISLHWRSTLECRTGGGLWFGLKIYEKNPSFLLCPALMYVRFMYFIFTTARMLLWRFKFCSQDCIACKSWHSNWTRADFALHWMVAVTNCVINIFGFVFMSWNSASQNVKAVDSFGLYFIRSNFCKNLIWLYQRIFDILHSCLAYV